MTAVGLFEVSTPPSAAIFPANSDAHDFEGSGWDWEVSST